MTDLAVLKAKRDQLISQLSITRSMSHGDTSKTNRSVDEIMKLVELLDTQIGGLEHGRRRPRYVTQTTKGL